MKLELTNWANKEIKRNGSKIDGAKDIIANADDNYFNWVSKTFGTIENFINNETLKDIERKESIKRIKRMGNVIRVNGGLNVFN